MVYKIKIYNNVQICFEHWVDYMHELNSCLLQRKVSVHLTLLYLLDQYLNLWDPVPRLIC